MLTISRVARLAGTTPRAVRLYHSRGLLPEPERLENGYRCYSATDAVALIRIRRLAALGVPLGRMAPLLADGSSHALHEALDALDVALARQEGEIARKRAALAAVRTLDDPTLPAFLNTQLAVLRAAGYPEELLDREIDALHVVLANASERDLAVLTSFAGLVRSDPGFVAGVVEVAQAFEALGDVDVDSPYVAVWVDRVLDVLRDFLESHTSDVAATGLGPDFALILEDVLGSSFSPAQERASAELMRRVDERISTGSANPSAGHDAG